MYEPLDYIGIADVLKNQQSASYIRLRLNPTVASKINEARASQPTNNKRESDRYVFRYGQQLRVVLLRDSGSISAECMVRDISSGGIGLFVGAFVHPGTECAIETDLDSKIPGSVLYLHGVVKWCKHFSQSVHEAGIEINHEDQNYLRAISTIAEEGGSD